jgi:hypothetical protein
MVAESAAIAASPGAGTPDLEAQQLREAITCGWRTLRQRRSRDTPPFCRHRTQVFA